MTTPIYSVIVPAYNAEKTIGSCLEALTRQSAHSDEYEVIVVDDGSRDRTGKIVKTFPVRYLNQPNKGPAAARNRGVREARGAIIFFTDSDCVPQQNWLDEMVKPFSNPSIVAVKGAYRTNQRSLTARFAQAEFEERFEMLRRVASIDMVDTYSAAYRRAVFMEAGGFDESFPVANNEDTELSYKLSRMGHKMTFNPDAIVYHLNHPDSVKRYARLKFWRGYWRMVVYRKYPDKMMKDSYTPQTLKLQILFLFISFACLLFSCFLPTFMIQVMACSIFLFCFSVLPFTFAAVKNDAVIGMLSPFFISLRAASLGFGIIWGMVSARRAVNKQ